MVCNQLPFGTIMLPLEDHQSLADDLVTLTDTLLEASVKADPLVPDEVFDEFLPEPIEPSTHGFDEVYLINLGKSLDSLSYCLGGQMD